MNLYISDLFAVRYRECLDQLALLFSALWVIQMKGLPLFLSSLHFHYIILNAAVSISLHFQERFCCALECYFSICMAIIATFSIIVELLCYILSNANASTKVVRSYFMGHRSCYLLTCVVHYSSLWNARQSKLQEKSSECKPVSCRKLQVITDDYITETICSKTSAFSKD